MSAKGIWQNISQFPFHFSIILQAISSLIESGDEIWITHKNIVCKKAYLHFIQNIKCTTTKKHVHSAFDSTDGPLYFETLPQRQIWGEHLICIPSQKAK